MGIRDLNKFIHSLGVYKKAPLSCLAGRAVAIDASNWIYVNWTMAAKRVIGTTNLLLNDPDSDSIRKHWFDIAWKSINRFLLNGVYPVFVFDGPAPAEKSKEKQKRAQEKQKAVDKYNEALTNARNQTDILDAGNIDMKNLRQLCCNAYKIDWGEFDLVKGLLDALGFQTFKPNCEAEKFCSMLCLEGLVVAVFSTDTDNLAYSCPCFINDISSEATMDGPADMFTYAQHQDVLSASGLTREQFLDLCIMHGTDYNDRIYRVGPANILKLIREYGSIEAIHQSGRHNVTCLNHLVCRRLFSYETSTSLNNGEPVVISFKDISSIDPEVYQYYTDMFEATPHVMTILSGIKYVQTCANSVCN